MPKDQLHQAALDYHQYPQPGKISVELTKSAETADDLSLAYSPGVAAPVLEIAEDPNNAYRYTAKGNLVAVISNGTAILGLGNLGPLASKPVMEGKALLFKRFAGVDAIDIEVTHDTQQEFIDTVANIADSFGGINLEDIKAPECFAIEEALIERCNVPVFHDDQHGTAIVTVAGLLNALEIQGKSIEDARIVVLGAGSAGLSLVELMQEFGAKKDNIFVLDRGGVIHNGRTDLNQYKQRFAIDTELRTLDDVITDADVFIGVSGANLLSPEQLKRMAANPVVFACANPDPEIKPELAHETRDDIIMGTGRSDYPNQINNVLGFPFIFRGALDVHATRINMQMKCAAVEAIRDLAKETVPTEVLLAAGASHLEFGRGYVIPKPMDPRLKSRVSRAVALAAEATGVNQRPVPQDYMLEKADVLSVA
ncbi:malic enzyme-like NAD(P)-binding protein [Dongshaea marina]|uniref:malic enzyme-like NAD(P)-binding protein n=1 Tax=Dongshaea marina TaxID=2047966 RepID=UPI000D3E27F1|nr:malic enzyme-like NAD(P)-binding protein [Dongshaea marina]